MADHCAQLPRRSRLIRRGLTTCGWLVAAVMLYVASIGPLAWLNTHGFGGGQTWERLHRTVYRPVFDVWWFGPRWVSSSLGWYTGLFDGSSGWRRADRRHFTKGYNDLNRVARIDCQMGFEDPTESELREWSNPGYFSLWEYDLLEDVKREFKQRYADWPRTNAN